MDTSYFLYKGRVLFLFIVLCLSTLTVHAQTDPDPEQLRRQQELIRQLRLKLFPESDVRLQAPIDPSIGEILPHEQACYTIKTITLQALDRNGEPTDKHPFLWAQEAANNTDKGTLDTPISRCLGSAGINLVMKRIQNAIVAKGFVTTRVLAGPQNLKTGELRLMVIPGRIRELRMQDPASSTALLSAIPADEGEMLYLRDIEQGLENLKRVPSAEADIQIAPSTANNARPGDSDLIVVWRQKRPHRVNLSLDNAGSESTGKYQGALTLSYDNPFKRNDLFYFTLNNDLDGGQSGERGTSGKTLHYSIPWAYWLLSGTAGESEYFQAIAGATEESIYRGTNETRELSLARTVYRDAKRKTQLQLAGWQRNSNNFIDDTEVEIQRRKMAGWEFSINHTEYLPRTTVQVQLKQRQGTGAFGSLAAPEDNFDEGTARPKITKLNLTTTTPFRLWGQSWSVRNNLRAQWNQTPLIPQDRFSIGSRYTVRGFDGQRTLSGDRGSLIRNDLSMRIGQSNHQIVLGFDYGSVDGQSTSTLIGEHLAGASLGFKGVFNTLNLSYDLAYATPISEPDGFESDSDVINANLNWGF